MRRETERFHHPTLTGSAGLMICLYSFWNSKIWTSAWGKTKMRTIKEGVISFDSRWQRNNSLPLKEVIRKMIVSPKWTKVLKIDPKQVASLSDIALKNGDLFRESDTNFLFSTDYVTKPLTIVLSNLLGRLYWVFNLISVSTNYMLEFTVLRVLVKSC